MTKYAFIDHNIPNFVIEEDVENNVMTLYGSTLEAARNFGGSKLVIVNEEGNIAIKDVVSNIIPFMMAVMDFALRELKHKGLLDINDDTIERVVALPDRLGDIWDAHKDDQELVDYKMDIETMSTFGEIIGFDEALEVKKFAEETLGVSIEQSRKSPETTNTLIRMSILALGEELGQKLVDEFLVKPAFEEGSGVRGDAIPNDQKVGDDACGDC